LAVWLKADDLTHITYDATTGQVSQWADQTPNANNANQGATGNQPTLVSNSLNGEPVIHFDGSTSFLDITDNSSVRPGSAITVYAVMRSSTTSYPAGYGDVVAKALDINNDLGWTAPYFSYDLGFGNNNIVQGYLSTGGGTSDELTGNTAQGEGAQISSLEYDGTTQTVTTDGTVQASQAVTGGLFYNTSAEKDLIIGAARTAQQTMTRFLNGDVAEILVYNRALSTAEGQQAEVYLANKYAVPSAIPLAIFPLAGNYYQQAQVSILPAVAGTPIYYTTDGSTPTATSTLYTGPFTLSGGSGTVVTTVNAVAIPSGQSPSSVCSSAYTILPYPPGTPAAIPVANPPSRAFAGTINVALTSTSPGATIVYTLDGTTPTQSSTVYTGAIPISSATTLNALAFSNTLANSPVLTQTYTVDTGPQLTNLQFNGTALPNNGTITGTGTLSIAASSPYTVTKVQFSVDGTLIATDTNGPNGSYSTFFDPSSLADGTHTVQISATDSNSAVSSLSQSFTLALAVPSAPVITTPANGNTTAYNQISVSGTATPNTTITFYDNGSAVTGQTTITAAQDGTFLGSVPLSVGQNQIQATATNRAGAGPESSIVTVTYDNTLPQPPPSLSVSSLPGGQIALNWTSSNTASVTGYEIFRSTTPITSTAGLTPIATVTSLTYTDLPSSDGTYYYTVIAVLSTGVSSPISAVPSGISDRTPPTASIQYVAQGAYDSSTGNYGVGTVNVTVTTSEPLSAAPFLTVLPPNGLPLPVLLSPGFDNLHYVGTLIIASSTPSGLAVASFSGLDLAGNRGTQLTSGQNLSIVTAGPQVTQLVVSPNGAIQNSSTSPATMTFTATVIPTLSETLPSGAVPQFSYSLSSTATTPVAISSVTAGTSPNTWNISLPLPSTAGQPPETLTLYYQATDSLGNIGTQIVPTHQFQVYQGNLPGLNPPAQLTAQSLPAGVIQLNWTSVPQATGYVIYRGSSPGALTQLATLSTVLTYQDTTAQPDGTYYYAVATAWQQGSQTSVGAQSSPVVPGISISVPPPAPSGLAAQVISTGVQLTWTDPVNPTSVITLSLYRSGSTITSLTGLTPLVTNIPLGNQAAVDPTPLPGQPYYALVAVDAAGNVSSLTTAYANVSLLPVTAFTITQNGSNPPVVTWSDPTPGLSGYDIFLGPTGSQVKLDNPSPLPASTTSYTDTGYSGSAQLFTIVAYDANGVASLGRSLSLVPLTATLDPSAVIERGIMNQLNYTVSNPSAQAVTNVQLVINVGGVNQTSGVFSIAAGGSAVVPVVVGGYSSLTGTSTTVTATINVTPNPGELVSIIQSETVPVAASQLGLQVLASNFTLGGTGQAQFTLTNTSAVPIEIICAEATGNQPSPDVRFNLLDGNGNIIAQQALQLTTGNDVTTLPSGESVIQLPAGASVTTPAVNLTVPANLGASVTVQAQIDHIYYDRGQSDEVDLSGLQAVQNVATTQVPYSGLVTSVTPANSTGNQPIVISGIALVTGTTPANPTPVPNANLNLNISTNGFLRTFPITTDSSGNFTYTFTPVTGEPGGSYNVWAINPLLTDTTPQMQFTIQALIVSPTTINLQAPTNFPQTLTLNLTNSPSGPLTNVSVAYNAADQPGSAFAQGITVTPGASIATLASGQSGTLQATILADGTAPSTGTLYLRVASTENPNWQLVQVNYSFAAAVPVLQVTPSSPSIGVAPGQTQPVSQTINLTNVGLAPLTGANIVLQTSQGTLPPSWATLSSASTINSLAVNASQNIAVTFAPGSTIAVGDYYFQVVITAQNYPAYTVPIHVSVNTATTSGGSFLIVDNFTPGNITTGFTGGLSGATVTLQNQAIYSSVFSVTTGSDGLASFSNLPVGTYSVQVTAAQHQTYSSTLVVQPGIQFSQQVVLQYNPVTVTWNVTSTTIQDDYNLVFTTTFDTSVPLPVVTFTPGVINLPQLNQGDVYNVQATITNNGLIAADNVQIQMPPEDAYFQYALLGTPPTQLAAGQSVTLYYKLTCLQSLPAASAASLQSGRRSNRAFVNNVEKHPMPLYYRLMSMLIGQTSPGGNGYGANVYLTFSATCSNGTLFTGNASQTLSYIGADTPKAAQLQAQLQINNQQAQGAPAGGGGGPVAPIVVAPAAKCAQCQITLQNLPDDQNKNPGAYIIQDNPANTTQNSLWVPMVVGRSDNTGILSLTTASPYIQIWYKGNNYTNQPESWYQSLASFFGLSNIRPFPITLDGTTQQTVYVQGIQPSQADKDTTVTLTSPSASSDTAKMTIIQLQLMGANLDASNNPIHDPSDYHLTFGRSVSYTFPPCVDSQRVNEYVNWYNRGSDPNKFPQSINSYQPGTSYRDTDYGIKGILPRSTNDYYDTAVDDSKAIDANNNTTDSAVNLERMLFKVRINVYGNISYSNLLFTSHEGALGNLGATTKNGSLAMDPTVYTDPATQQQYIISQQAILVYCDPYAYGASEISPATLTFFSQDPRDVTVKGAVPVPIVPIEIRQANSPIIPKSGAADPNAANDYLTMYPVNTPPGGAAPQANVNAGPTVKPSQYQLYLDANSTSLLEHNPQANQLPSMADFPYATNGGVSPSNPIKRPLSLINRFFFWITANDNVSTQGLTGTPKGIIDVMNRSGGAIATFNNVEWYLQYRFRAGDPSNSQGTEWDVNVWHHLVETGTSTSLQNNEIQISSQTTGFGGPDGLGGLGAGDYDLFCRVYGNNVIYESNLVRFKIMVQNPADGGRNNGHIALDGSDGLGGGQNQGHGNDATNQQAEVYVAPNTNRPLPPIPNVISTFINSLTLPASVTTQLPANLIGNYQLWYEGIVKQESGWGGNIDDTTLGYPYMQDWDAFERVPETGDAVGQFTDSGYSLTRKGYTYNNRLGFPRCDYDNGWGMSQQTHAPNSPGYSANNDYDPFRHVNRWTNNLQAGWNEFTGIIPDAIKHMQGAYGTTSLNAILQTGVSADTLSLQILEESVKEYNGGTEFQAGPNGTVIDAPTQTAGYLSDVRAKVTLISPTQ
jgi:large repetitive protein